MLMVRKEIRGNLQGNKKPAFALSPNFNFEQQTLPPLQSLQTTRPIILTQNEI